MLIFKGEVKWTMIGHGLILGAVKLAEKWMSQGLFDSNALLGVNRQHLAQQI